jgi:hypothetical protein
MQEVTDLSPFISGTRLQFAWDSTSLGALKFCPRKYQLSIIEGWESKRRNVHLTFGILLHSSRERYYHAKTQGQSHDEALLQALAYLLEQTFDQELGKPWDSGDSAKNRFTLARTLVWYCDTWRDDPLETITLANGKPAVELSFRFDSGLRAPNGEAYLLCGHIDRLARFNEQAYVSDLKTTGHGLDQTYFLGFSPDNQLSLYAFASQVAIGHEVSGIIIDAAQVLVNGSRFQRGIVPRSKDQLEEWYDDLAYWLSQAVYYAHKNYWPMNDQNCYRCEFRKICAKSPSTRSEWLRADFQPRAEGPWNPLRTRGDI